MRIRAKRRITHKHDTHEIGDVFEMPDDQAEALIKQGHAESVEPEDESQDSGDNDQ